MLQRPLVRGAIGLVLLAALAAAAVAVQTANGDGDGDGTLIAVPTATPCYVTVEPWDGTPITREARACAESPGRAPPDSTGALDDNAPIIGEPAPDFLLVNLEDRLVRLSNLRGKVVWVNFWASWCRPCRKELPGIQKLQDEYPDDLIVLAVNYKESRDIAAQYASELGLSLTVLLDRQGEVYDQYRLQGLPDSFFIDRDGNVATLQFGYLSESKMRERLRQAGLP